jgi:hypothetical protein
MWDWIPEDERRMMADVFAMEDGRRREAAAKRTAEYAPPPKEFPGSVYAPPGVYCSTGFATDETEGKAVTVEHVQQLRKLRGKSFDQIIVDEVAEIPVDRAKAKAINFSIPPYGMRPLVTDPPWGR